MYIVLSGFAYVNHYVEIYNELNTNNQNVYKEIHIKYGMNLYFSIFETRNKGNKVLFDAFVQKREH